MCDKNKRVCPVERAGMLTNRFRRWLHNPQKILAPYVREGMTVLDLGCGPGFFSITLADMVGNSGHVIAADLQEGMLQKLKEKIRGTRIEERIKLHKCGENRIGISEHVDFVLAFYVVHEIPDHEELFKEIYSIVKSNGQLLIVEPKFFHVSKLAFEETVQKTEKAGFVRIEQPKILISRSMVLRKN